MSFWVGLSMRKKSERGESRKNERRCSFQEVCYLGKKLESKQMSSTVEVISTDSESSEMEGF